MDRGEAARNLMHIIGQRNREKQVPHLTYLLTVAYRVASNYLCRLKEMASGQNGVVQAVFVITSREARQEK